MISQVSQQKKRKDQHSQPKQWAKSAAAHRNRVEVKLCQPQGQRAHELLNDWKDAT